MSTVGGDKNGIAVWSKLFHSKDAQVQEYIQRLYSALNEGKSVYFSDFEEQKKKRNNNQTVYKFFYDQAASQWKIELFLVPQQY